MFNVTYCFILKHIIMIFFFNYLAIWDKLSNSSSTFSSETAYQLNKKIEPNLEKMHLYF